jgi:hypothetical protein
MSGDLEELLQSIASTQQRLLNRIQALEANQITRQARDWGPTSTNTGFVVPTDPPSTSVIVRGGMVWAYAISDVATSPYQIKPLGWNEVRVDLASYADEFIHAYYYRYGILAANLRNDPPTFNLWENTALFAREHEYENPEFATRALDGDLYPAGDPDLVDTFGDGCLAFPVAIIMLRNNGTTGSTGEILPVTYHDQEQSFIVTDCRPWMNLVCSYVY